MEQLEFLHTVPRLERFIVCSAILLVDDDRRMVVLNQKTTHRQPTSSAVSICKWVDILKLRMEICCGRQGISNLQSLKSLQEARPSLPCLSHNLQLVGARPLNELVSSGIVGVLCQHLLKFTDQLCIQRTFSAERRQ